MKTCRTCGETLPLSSFAKNRAAKDGLQYVCRQCDKAYQSARRARNPEENRKYSREYQTKRREGFEYRLQMLLNASKQRARLKGREHTLTLEDIKELYPTDGKCPVFGIVLEFGDAGFRENSPSLDRIDSKGGYTKGNVQVVSWKANRLKSYATVEELETLVTYLRQGEYHR